MDARNVTMVIHITKLLLRMPCRINEILPFFVTNTFMGGVAGFTYRCLHPLHILMFPEINVRVNGFVIEELVIHYELAEEALREAKYCSGSHVPLQ